EEEVLLADPLGLQRRMQRAVAVDEILFLLELFAADAVPALVQAFVNIARVVDASGDFGDAGAVARLGGAAEIVERGVEPAAGPANHLLHAIAVRERIEPLLLRLLEHVLRVLVVPHQETGVEAAESFVARDDVGAHLLVRRPEVRLAVDVIDGRRQKEALHRSPYAVMAAACTSFTDTPLSAASLAQSSNSGTAFTTRPSRRATLKRTAPSGVSTETISRWRHSRSTSWWRSPIVVVSRKITSLICGRRSGAAITVSRVPGRFFFIWTAV